MDEEINTEDYVATLEAAAICDALFEQYDDQLSFDAANDDCYENLYPNIA